MDERLLWNAAQQVPPEQKLCYLPKAMFPVQNKMAAMPPRTFSSLAWGGAFPGYQQAMSIPYGISMSANPVNPYVMRRTPSIAVPTIHWHRNNRGHASFPAVLKTPFPSAMNVPRRYSGHRMPAFVSGVSAVHENISFVDSASYGSLLAEPVHAVDVQGAGTYNYRQWQRAVETAAETQPCPGYDATPVQLNLSGVVDVGAHVYDDAARTPSASNGFYNSQEVPDGCRAAVATDDADADGQWRRNACEAGDDDLGEWDETCQSCSEDEEESAVDIGDGAGAGSDEKTRDAVANLLTVMAEERRNRRWRRLANRRASGKRKAGVGSMNETVRKLISFTRMRCPYQEPVRSCDGIQPAGRACMNVKSVFWASDDYIQETTYAVKVLLEKY
ncbi:hypothetical protein NP493_172g03088 [Ridgeia piscesae]|uniref:Uncharacterized protein n=1 Tax=Ridgeia piscesae TaxID=27915 RepID=A0AAD9UFB8_RIDPI|nr:hypothetical protein NP493_172g03088 [Ridgeia piscesae]